MQQRFVQYDILKGIGILLVIVCHAGLGGFWKVLFYSFHMPLFFFVGGCFFHNYHLGNYLVKNIKQLLIPYLLFVLCMIIVRSFQDVNLSSYWTSISNAFTSIDPLDESDCYLYESIWFLICLFNVRILYWFINYVCNGMLEWKVVVCVLLYVIGYVFQRAEINIPLFIDTSLSVVIFYSMGEVFHAKGLDDVRVSWWLILIAFAICIIACWFLRPSVELKDNHYPLYLILISPIMISSLYFLSKGLSRFPDNMAVSFLNRAGVGSLCILGFHNQFFWIIGHFLNRILASFTSTFLEVLLVASMVLFTVLIILQIEKLIDRFAPFLLGKF